MKFAILLIISVVSFFSEGNAKEKETLHEVRVSFDPANLVICQEKMFLLTKSFGELSINNVHNEKGDYFTICPISFKCEYCNKRFEKNQENCNRCGSVEFVMTTKKSDENAFLAVDDVFLDLLDDLSFLEKENFFCSKDLTIWLEGEKDSDGNSSLSSGAKYKDEDSDTEYSAKGTIEKKDGKTNAKAQVEMKRKF